MSKPTGQRLASKAIELLNGEIIYYSEAKMKEAGDLGKLCRDCQGFMELIVQQCGGSMNYLGSNDMFRNACSWVGTIAEAKKLGYLVKGCALFILEHDGTEPAKYRADGIGNASHVGMYIGEKAYYDAEKKRWCNVAHSSASRGKVCGSTLQNAWTHVGLWLCADFEINQKNEERVNHVSEVDMGAPVEAEYAVITASSGSNVNFRTKTSTQSALVAKMPQINVGETVEVDYYQGDWAHITYAGFGGWVMKKFLVATTAGSNTNSSEVQRVGEVTTPSNPNVDTGNSTVDGAAVANELKVIQNALNKLHSLLGV